MSDKISMRIEEKCLKPNNEQVNKIQCNSEPVYWDFKLTSLDMSFHVYQRLVYSQESDWLSVLVLQGFGRVLWGRHGGPNTLHRGWVTIICAPWTRLKTCPPFWANEQRHLSAIVWTTWWQKHFPPLGKHSWCSSATRCQTNRNANITFRCVWRRYCVYFQCACCQYYCFIIFYDCIMTKFSTHCGQEMTSLGGVIFFGNQKHNLTVSFNVFAMTFQ